MHIKVQLVRLKTLYSDGFHISTELKPMFTVRENENWIYFSIMHTEDRAC